MTGKTVSFTVEEPAETADDPGRPERAAFKKKETRRKSSLKLRTKSEGGNDDGIESSSKGRVSFKEEVTVRELPSEEAEDAVLTRRGGWDQAPDHDELWDGDVRDFWQGGEKTMEEVQRIVVVRQMRLALQYNLGYAFFSLVANFKKRMPKEDFEGEEMGNVDDEEEEEEEPVPQFERPEDEEMAIRKEIRELFADSVKGLDFSDLVQDKEAFEAMYLATTLSGVDQEDRVLHPSAGLKKIQALVDEIMLAEEICVLLGLKYVEPSNEPLPPKPIQDAVLQVEETRRRKSIEIASRMPEEEEFVVANPVRRSPVASAYATLATEETTEAKEAPPPQSTRRASVTPSEDGSVAPRRGSVTKNDASSPSTGRRLSATTLEASPGSESAGTTRRASVERRRSIEGNHASPTLQEMRRIVEEEAQQLPLQHPPPRRLSVDTLHIDGTEGHSIHAKRVPSTNDDFSPYLTALMMLLAGLAALAQLLALRSLEWNEARKRRVSEGQEKELESWRFPLGGALVCLIAGWCLSG